ncbi:MAG: NADH-ubiquinone/plastoquinone oxidoreductase, chain 3, partial [Thermoanaerobaculia bacterium]|nr:NADH-ubiquinone/plastoquinone oxidoreductase, chain 3 [Thermoanaerobaculia bacterium]
MANYSVLLVAALIVISLPVLTLFIITPLVRASKGGKVKLEPYECGVPASSLAFDHRFSVRYFLIAVLFI